MNHFWIPVRPAIKLERTVESIQAWIAILRLSFDAGKPLLAFHSEMNLSLACARVASRPVEDIEEEDRPVVEEDVLGLALALFLAMGLGLVMAEVRGTPFDFHFWCQRLLLSRCFWVVLYSLGFLSS